MRIIVTTDGHRKEIVFTEETVEDEPDANFCLASEWVVWSGEVDLPTDLIDEVAEFTFREK